jgi:hypothetical protein
MKTLQTIPMNASDEEAWKYFSLKTIGQIANVFQVGVELLRSDFHNGQSQAR